jgi:hypothetical protein
MATSWCRKKPNQPSIIQNRSEGDLNVGLAA